MARWAGDKVVGTVSWVMSFATALLIFGKFGLDLGASRLASEFGVKEPGRLRRLFETALGLRLLFTLGVAVPSFAFARSIAVFFGDPALEMPVRLGALIVVCASVYEFCEQFLIGLNRLDIVYRVRSVHLMSRIAIVCVLVALGYGAVEILGGYTTAWGMAILVSGILLFRFLPAREGEVTSDMRRRLIVLSATLAVSAASVTIFTHMDRLMLGYFTDMAEVGQFAIARNITEVSLFPVFAMVMMLRPALASRFSQGKVDECAGIIRQSLRFGLASGMLFVAVFAVVAVPLVTLVFSDEFAYAGELMVLFIGIIALRSVGAVILPALIAAERTRVYAVLTAISAVINFGLNVILIPRYGASGAIVATIVSYGFLFLTGLREVFSTYSVKLGGRALSLAIRTILAAAVAAGVTWLVVDRLGAGDHAVLPAASLAIVYVGLIFLFRVGGVNDIRNLIGNLRGQRS